MACIFNLNYLLIITFLKYLKFKVLIISHRPYLIVGIYEISNSTATFGKPYCTEKKTLPQVHRDFPF